MSAEIPQKIRDMIHAGALFALNDSGGKDSQAMRIKLQPLIPRHQVVVVHASLGVAEWPGALEHAAAGAKSAGFHFVVARAKKTFLGMVENRFRSRPGVPSWPSSSTRQCTSDLKRDPIVRELRGILKSRGLLSLVNCMGIRAEESPARSKLVPLKRNERNSVAGREWWDWLPIHSMTRGEVLNTVTSAGEQLHHAYGLGNQRLSCLFCIMGSANDLRNAAIHHPGPYNDYVQLERRTGYTMHQSRRSLIEITGIEPRTP